MQKVLYKGVDLSHWNGNVNFKTLKQNGVDFAIIKAGGNEGKNYKDSKFIRYYNDAVNAGLHVGAYFFVGKNFITSKQGVKDAKTFLSQIAGLKFTFPVSLDLEVTPYSQKNGATEAAIAFCDTLEKEGYYVNIYSSDISGFLQRLNLQKLAAYDKWVARYGKEPQYVKSYGMWQYSSTGKFPGHKGAFDLDYAFKNYPLIIKKNGLNGW